MEKTLTERKKADRETMARLLAAHVVDAGGKAERNKEWNEFSPKEIKVDITAPGGACLSVIFDGTTPKNYADVYVSTWNFTPSEEYSGKKFNPALGDVNPFHQRKYSHISHGFDSLLANIKRDIRKFVDGSGYQHN